MTDYRFCISLYDSKQDIILKSNFPSVYHSIKLLQNSNSTYVVSNINQILIPGVTSTSSIYLSENFLINYLNSKYDMMSNKSLFYLNLTINDTNLNQMVTINPQNITFFSRTISAKFNITVSSLIKNYSTPVNVFLQVKLDCF